MQGILGLVDHLVALVLRVVDLFFGLTSAPIGLAFGFEVHVAGQDSSGLLGVALQLIRLGAHRAPPFSSSAPNRGPGASGLARGHSPLARGHSPPGPRIPRSDEPTHRTMVPGWIGTIRVMLDIGPAGTRPKHMRRRDGKKPSGAFAWSRGGRLPLQNSSRHRPRPILPAGPRRADPLSPAHRRALRQ